MPKTDEAGRLGDGPAPGRRILADRYPSKYESSSEKSSQLADLQASWLLARVGVSAAHARAVAELAFGRVAR